MITLQDRARGAFVGLAIGDMLGAPAEGKTPDQIQKQWGRITDFLSDDQTVSDDTEFALFSAQLILEKKSELTALDVVQAWRKNIITVNNNYKGAGFSEMLTIKNIIQGLQPPQSGKHLHSWSDGLAMRVAPYGIASVGKPELAAYFAKIDGSVSHAGEGIYSGQAVAAAIAEAMTGASLQNIFHSALANLPKDSWTASSINRAVKIGNDASDIWSALDTLYESLVCKVYYWPDIAPEAVGLAFGVISSAKGNFEDSVLGAVNIGRDADTIAALAGTICGALNGIQCIPKRWIKRITAVKGNCINSVAGMNIIEVADNLVFLAETWESRQ